MVAALSPEEQVALKKALRLNAVRPLAIKLGVSEHTIVNLLDGGKAGPEARDRVAAALRREGFIT